MQYATPWNRLLSAVTDFIVLRGVLDLVSLVTPQRFAAQSFLVTLAFFFSILVTYFVTRIVLKRRTLGMIVFGYAIVKNPKGKPLTWFEEILRFFSQGISTLLLFLPFTFSLFNAKRAHLADLVVDAVPVKQESYFQNSRPLQKFIGIMLLSLALATSATIFSTSPAVDFFARIVKGNDARIIHGVIAVVALVVGFMNLIGDRRASALGMGFYFILTASAVYTLIDFDAYSRRVIQNLRDTVNLASAQLTPGINIGMVKNLVREVETQTVKTLPSLARLNLAINGLQLAYMVYITFYDRFSPVRSFLLNNFLALRNRTSNLKLSFLKETK